MNERADPQGLGAPRGIAAWSVHHPVGVSMISLAVIVLGLFALGRLAVDLLPHIIYPEIVVRVTDTGVPATIMEDKVTRQLEEQLAITEGALGVSSNTNEGRSQVVLDFGYGKDIDVALRDASSRLDRAKRFLPTTIDAPVIYKRDPSQIPVMDFAISSRLRDPAELRAYIDYTFSKWFINLPGVAAVEVGGAPRREVLVLPDQERLAGHDLDLADLVEAIENNNLDSAGGTLRLSRQQFAGRTRGRFSRVEDLANLPIAVAERLGEPGGVVRLQDVAEVVDGYSDEQVRVRLNTLPGVKVSIQKQPQANTVQVADTVRAQLAWLHTEGLVPTDVRIDSVGDQSVYVRHAIGNAANAALSGAVLAMLVVFVFLGDIRRTLIIGTGIPIAIMVAMVIMAVSGLTLNVMTLGGLALGVGLLVDNTIVMLENVYRHQRDGHAGPAGAARAAAEVNGAIVASTSTNLAAVLPFLFISGLVGLLFRELIATISAAIIASLVVAITLVPALGARVPVNTRPNIVRRAMDGAMNLLGRAYAHVVPLLLRARWLVPVPFVAGLVWALPHFDTSRQLFLPELDDGSVRIWVVADPGISLDDMDALLTRVENHLMEQPEVATVFAQVGGAVFGRTVSPGAHRSRIEVQLVPADLRDVTTGEWVKQMQDEVRDMAIAGARIRMSNRGIRGLRVSGGDDELSLHIQGPDLERLARIADQVVQRLEQMPGVDNARHSAEDTGHELNVVLDRDRAADLGLSVEKVGRALRIALSGLKVTDFVEGDRSYDVRVRLPRAQMATVRDIERIALFSAAQRGDVADSRANSGGASSDRRRPTVYLGDVATVELVSTPFSVKRERQQRIVSINGNVAQGSTLGEVSAGVAKAMQEIELPAGYTMYDAGAAKTLAESGSVTRMLLALALFLVLVVMAVQYESLRNPLIILIGVPFALVGVAAAVDVLDMTLSMPVWLGLIMLAGIVVNNAIVLVEYIEQARGRGLGLDAAVVEAGRLRLRPILMTTLTTVVGMAPLALGLGEGAELLQPLAITIVWGLSFSTLVSLVLVPALYRLFGRRDRPELENPMPAGNPIPSAGS